jgi:hypothetical protein
LAGTFVPFRELRAPRLPISPPSLESWLCNIGLLCGFPLILEGHGGGGYAP